jgi:hypothetical protein
MPKTKVRKRTTYIIADDEDREFEVEHEPLDHMDKEIHHLPTGHTVVGYVADDTDPFSPREDDNFGTMVCWHDRHDLGDDHSYSDVEDLWKEIIGDDVYEAIEEKFEAERNAWHEAHPKDQYGGKAHMAMVDDVSKRERAEVMEAVEKVAIVLPLFLYDHSGITMSTSRAGQYADRWDSSAVGYIYVTHEKALETWSCKTLDDPVDYHDGKPHKPCRERALDLLEAEVGEYDKYIMNETYMVCVHVYKDDERVEDEEGDGPESRLGTEYADEEMAVNVRSTCRRLLKAAGLPTTEFDEKPKEEAKPA